MKVGLRGWTMLWAGWALIALLAGWLYLPGLAGPPVLDDRANLTVLADIDDDPQYLSDVVLGNRSGKLGRPLSMLSFALEKACCDNGLWGIKRTNLLIHLFNSALVLLLINAVLRHLRYRHAAPLALLAASAWLLSPLYVSTVLYAVQRMAQLSTLFVLLGLISYCAWRKGVIAGHPRHAWLALCATSVVLGFTAKENAILMLPLAAVLECFVYRFAGPGGSELANIRRRFYLLALVGACSLVMLAWWRPEVFLGAYELRHFTLGERLLTEARILWDYVGQLMWPDPRRMGVFQDDFELSRGLMDPPTTAVALVAWMAVLLAALAGLRWRALGLLVFGAVFFLVGHSLESTVFALELYFEHRNYLPGVGLYLGLAVVLGALLQRIPAAAGVTLVVGALAVALLAMMTASQVRVWSSPFLLHMEAVNAHPGSVRARIEYANYLARLGFIEEALEHSREVGVLRPGESVAERTSRELALHCLADHPLPGAALGGFVAPTGDLALREIGNALQVLVEQVQRGYCPSLDAAALADEFATLYLTGGDAVPSTQVFLVLALLENHLRRPKSAMGYTARLLERGADSPQVHLMHFSFAVSAGEIPEADRMDAWLEAAHAQGRLTRQQYDTWQVHLR